MRRPLAILAAAALLAWLWRRHPEPRDPAWDEDEDGVQPPDPVTLYRPVDLGPQEVAPFWEPLRHPFGIRVTDSAFVPDPTYIEAREVAIRRGGQSSERSLEGT